MWNIFGIKAIILTARIPHIVLVHIDMSLHMHAMTCLCALKLFSEN